MGSVGVGEPREAVKAGPASSPGKPNPGTPKLHAQVAAAQVQDVLSLLLLFRFINALCVRTFFQPDEYFQALEPAWSIAFGSNSGAWLTWEWQHQLRSSLHPAIFGLAYKAVDGAMSFLHLFPPFRAFMLVALPGALQSVFAALGDFYTWKLAMDIYGRESNAPWAALWMTVLSPWQWYCSTRTFSNSLETTLTIAALCYWPWELLADAINTKEAPVQPKSTVTSLRISLVLAAVAVLLRPTNLLIWLAVLGLSLARMIRSGEPSLKIPTLLVLLPEIVICGLAALAVSVVSDRLYFGFWTFPPYKWLYFNISQSLAVLYGRMPWHYYLSQGVPLLTTTFLPFTLVGLYKATFVKDTSTLQSKATFVKGVYTLQSKGASTLQSSILKTLNITALTMIAVLSLISHKEVRFIYPLLPILHILAAPYIATFFTQPTTTTTRQPTTPTTRPITLRHKLTLTNLLSLNLLLAGYLTLFHQPAPLSVLSFLRTDFERIHPDALDFSLTTTTTNPANANANPNGAEGKQKELFALFLTPCHTTPWRSHLVYPALRARALTCEPPLHTAPGTAERKAYLDEADRFYLPEENDKGDGEGKGKGYGIKFLREEMWPLSLSLNPAPNSNTDGDGAPEQRAGEIPRYIVGFEGIEPVLRQFFEGADAPGRGMGVTLRRVWSAWNGVFNEDWRRSGRLVVWDTGVYAGSYVGVEGEVEGREQTTDAQTEEQREGQRVVDEL